jgi:hypothetical protein
MGRIDPGRLPPEPFGLSLSKPSTFSRPEEGKPFDKLRADG